MTRVDAFAAPPGTSASVLVVEDNAVLCDTIRDLLLDERFRVFSVGTLTRAAQVLSSQKIDVILTDYVITGALSPDGQGFDRFLAIAGGIPIVVMTGYARSTDLLGLDVADVIEKPFDSADLAHRLRLALRPPEPLSIS